MKERSKIILIFGLCLVMFLLIGFYSYFNAKQYKEDSQWVTHTYEVIAKAQGLLGYLTDMGIASRNYATSGQNSYLEQYKDAIKNKDSTLRAAKQMTQDNPPQRLLLDTIDQFIIAKQNYGYAMISAKQTGGTDQVKEMILANTSQKINKQYRDAIGRFILHEKNLLMDRQAKQASQFDFVFQVVAISIVLVILFIIIAMYYFLKDHKRRVISEQQLLESELRTKKFLDVLPLGVYIVDKVGNTYYSNTKSEEILGKRNIDDIGITGLAELYQTYKAGTDDLYPASELPIARALRGETVTVDDLEIFKNGKRHPLRINATAVLDSHGQIAFAISVFEDITALKLVERELRHAKVKAEESSILKETFLANMSHEIRTPMNAIIGFTDILQKMNKYGPEREYLDIIRLSGENLLHLINDILDISKIEAGMITFEETPFHLSQIMHGVKSTLVHKAKLKDISLMVKTDGAIPDTVSGDPNRLTQILTNLIDNAIKFTHKGSVEVNAKLVKETQDACTVLFSVKDTGIGIAPEKLELIFERFQQAERNTTRKYGGTGLGLSIARQLVNKQGGKMEIKSTANVGTEFSFTLPFHTSIAALVPAAHKRNIDLSELSHKNILLAEDNSLNVKLMLFLFAEHNIQVDVVENGLLAVEKVRNGNYDLILMDVEMPEMNGYEATAVIRNELHNPIPIIAMTAHAMSGEREKCLAAGMTDYISKPVSAQLLFEKVYTHLVGE